MKQLVLIQRMAQAQNRISESATELLSRLDMPDDLREDLLGRVNKIGKAPDQEHKRLFQLEGIAAMLEAIIDPATAIENHIRSLLPPEEDGQDGDDSTADQSNRSESPALEIASLKALTKGQVEKLSEYGVTDLAGVNELTDDELEEIAGIKGKRLTGLRNEIADRGLEPFDPSKEGLENDDQDSDDEPEEIDTQELDGQVGDSDLASLKSLNDEQKRFLYSLGYTSQAAVAQMNDAVWELYDFDEATVGAVRNEIAGITDELGNETPPEDDGQLADEIS